MSLHHPILPSVKGTVILLSSYALNFLTENVRSVGLWTLTVILTVLGIYDFFLKIRYKHRMERERKQAIRNEKSKQGYGKDEQIR